MKGKKLCKWKRKDYEGKFDELTAVVGNAAFVCMKCGRAAVDAKWLCRPEKIDKKA